jgi:hypothetical protein
MIFGSNGGSPLPPQAQGGRKHAPMPVYSEDRLAKLKGEYQLGGKRTDQPTLRLVQAS